MEIQLLDDILKYLLHIQRAEKPYMVGNNEIDFSFDKIPNEIMKAAVDKLIKDEYIKPPKKDFESRTVYLAGIYSLTFEGMVFIGQGGYESELKRLNEKEKLFENLQEEQRRQSKVLVRLNFWIAFGAIIVAVDSILNIMTFYGVTFETLKKFKITFLTNWY